MSKPTLKVTSDFTDNFNAIIKRFKNDDVLVGIPEDSTARKDDNEMSNAALLAINNFGSPARNIPPRPVMQIGIQNAKEDIAEQFKKLAQNVLKKGFAAFDIYYERAGIIASNSIKKAINDQDGFPGPSKTTLAIRRAGGFHNWLKFGANLDPLSFRKKDVKDVGGFVGDKALIVTGQMRNAITYVVRSKA